MKLETVSYFTILLFYCIYDQLNVALMSIRDDSHIYCIIKNLTEGLSAMYTVKMNALYLIKKLWQQITSNIIN